MEQLVRQGKTLYAGISNYSLAESIRIGFLFRQAGVQCVAHQCNYNLLNRWVEDGLLDALPALGMGAAVFTAVAQGLLSDATAEAGRPRRHRARKHSTRSPPACRRASAPTASTRAGGRALTRDGNGEAAARHRPAARAVAGTARDRVDAAPPVSCHRNHRLFEPGAGRGGARGTVGAPVVEGRPRRHRRRDPAATGDGVVGRTDASADSFAPSHEDAPPGTMRHPERSEGPGAFLVDAEEPDPSLRLRWHGSAGRYVLPARSRDTFARKLYRCASRSLNARRIVRPASSRVVLLLVHTNGAHESSPNAVLPATGTHSSQE